MINIDIIRELIEHTPQIKGLFAKESYVLSTRYNGNTRKHEPSAMELEIIYKHPQFRNWKEQLCIELTKIEDDTYISGILDLLNGFSGFGDKTRFEKLETKLYVLKDHLDEYKENCDEIKVDDTRIPEKEICDKILRSLSKLQRNHNYNANSSEDTMNDYIRDILDESYIIKDQTRQGDSENGNEAGEVDIQICYDGLPVVMIEGIKVASLDRGRLDTHMNKVLTRYDPNGCPYAFLIVYTTAKHFATGYESIFNYFKEYEYPFPRETDLMDVDTGYGELKNAQIILNRNGQKIRVHIWVSHII